MTLLEPVGTPTLADSSASNVPLLSKSIQPYRANPGYQSILKDLKQSTKQRFMAIEFDYPMPAIEAQVVAHEAGVGAEIAQRLVKIAEKVRNLKNHGLEEGVSTRLLIYAATLIKQGVPAERACDVALARPITDDPDMLRSIVEVVKAVF